MTKLHDLHEVGQATWLNYMRRAFIQSGGLREQIGNGIQGVTANAAVFEQTISRFGDYDEQIEEEVRAGTAATRIQDALMVDDVQRAADLLHPIYEESEGLNGFASIELNPALTVERVCAVATARHMLSRIDRGNVMVELPATPEGIRALELLTVDGVSVNCTHIFSIAVYERAAQAYIAGLEGFFESHSVWRTAPTAVASFSVAPIDEAVDKDLVELERMDLVGKTGVAMARVLYARFQAIFSGPRWSGLASKGARVLRPKWTRIEALYDSQRETFYADELVGRDTVQTFTLPVLEAFLQHGSATPTIHDDLDGALEQLSELRRLGVDLEKIAKHLQEAHLADSDAQYQSLVQSVVRKLFVDLPDNQQ